MQNNISRIRPPYYDEKKCITIPGLIVLCIGYYYKKKHCQCSHTRVLKHNLSLLLLAVVVVITSLKRYGLEQFQVK